MRQVLPARRPMAGPRTLSDRGRAAHGPGIDGRATGGWVTSPEGQAVTAAPLSAASRAGQPGQKQVAIVCESTACLPAELARRFDVGVIPVPFVFGTESYRDGVDMSP